MNFLHAFILSFVFSFFSYETVGMDSNNEISMIYSNGVDDNDDSDDKKIMKSGIDEGKTELTDVVDSNELNIYAFDSGQANFIVMRKGNDAYIIDAGYGAGCRITMKDNPKFWQKDTNKTYSNFNTYKKDLNGILKGATIKKIFITHTHDDHCNLLKPIIDNASDDRYKIDEECDVFVGADNDQKLQNISLPKYFIYYDGTSICFFSKQQNRGIYKDGTNESRKRLFNDNPVKANPWAQIPNSYSDFEDLNNRIRAENNGLSFTIFPNRVTPKDNDPNTYSYALLVEFNNKKILFCGDYILGGFVLSKDLLNECDIVFLPHHGSSNTGSDSFKEAGRTSNGQDKVEEMIGTGDDSIDEELDKEGTMNNNASINTLFDKLPAACLFFVCGGRNSNVTNCSVYDMLCEKKCTGTELLHLIHITAKDNSNGKRKNYVINTERPLYTTTAAANGYYKISVSDSGINVSDGEPNDREEPDTNKLQQSMMQSIYLDNLNLK